MLATTQEVARALQVQPVTIMRMLKDGRIPMRYATKTHAGRSGRWRFNLQGIEEHMLAQNFEPPEYPK